MRNWRCELIDSRFVDYFNISVTEQIFSNFLLCDPSCFVKRGLSPNWPP